ncbi:MAG: shikimate dehydrogenase [Thaumarchaeota archaeon]|nr:shikimate dehydrogenase [Nitrososphaerota archaeon]
MPSPSVEKDLYYLIGRDVTESPSPSMMNAAFSELSIDALYVAISLDDDALEDRFTELKGNRLKGMNVTIPFKSAIIPLLDGLDALSARIGAVNTVKKEGKRFMGHNTDVEGIVRPLEKFFDEGQIGRVVVIGSGGAARAFFEAMSRFRCKRVSILVRDKSRASRFASEMRSRFGGIEVELHSFSESGPLTRSSFHLLFNASPIGSGGIPLPEPVRAIVRSSATVFDAVYRPMRTELIAEAERSGAQAISGYEMLLHQGGASFELWTGREAPLGVMEERLLRSLGAEGH